MTYGLALDRARTQAIYQQIAEQFEQQICAGKLPVGTRLPTIRELAAALGVTRLTAHSAYAELQARGWVESVVGRGTFVTSAAPARRLATLDTLAVSADAVMEDMGRIPAIRGLKSMAYAQPDTALLPAKAFAEALASVQGTGGVHLPNLLAYATTQGDAGLRVELAKWLHDQQIDVTPDEILITTGATQALSLAALTLARPHDVVVVEQPTYVGNLHTLRTLGLEIVSAPLDEHGVALEALERIFRQRHPRFFFTIPSFHNPTGILMPEQRRRDVLTLALRYGVLIIEDDTYSQMSLDGPPPIPLKAYDEHGIVIYINSVSKTLMPGLRVGFLLASEEYFGAMLSTRRALDISGNALIQVALAEFMRRGEHRNHLRTVLPHYRQRRDAMLGALQVAMPHGTQWSRPSGGFSCWVELPLGVSAEPLYHAAIDRGVAFTPGNVFFSEATNSPFIRLCFCNLNAEALRDSIHILGELMRDQLRATRRPVVPLPLT